MLLEESVVGLEKSSPFKPFTIQQLVVEDAIVDEQDNEDYIGKSMYIDTIWRKNKYGFLQAVIEKKGKYVAQGRRHYVVIWRH